MKFLSPTGLKPKDGEPEPVPPLAIPEYFEPLLLIVSLSLFDLKKPNIKVLKDNKTVLKFLFYFSIYFFSSYYYRYNISTI